MRKDRVLKKVVLFTFMFLLLSFISGICSFAGEDSEGWTSLKKDVYINGKSIAYQSDHTVSLWVKIIPDEDSDVLLAARELLMSKGRDDKALAYYYSGFLTEINCSENSHRELITIFYDANKNILHSADHSRAAWAAISPGSSFHLVQKAVCDKSSPFASNKNDGVRSGC